MGQLMSSEEELAELKETVGFVIYDAMVEQGAVPDLSVVHPLLLANQNEEYVFQEHLLEQRVWELQEVMEEYLKRCKISLSDKRRLIEDSVRLETQLSLILTQLKTCLLGGGCDSRSLRHWACGAAFHTQMLVHLACFEDKPEPLSARAALDQYRGDFKQIRAAYRCYKSTTVCVLKCRGFVGNSDPSQDVPEEGAMTGLTVTDRESGKSVTIPLSVMEAEIGRRKSSQVNLDLITSEYYSEAYLDHLFSDSGPVAELENYFIDASERLATHRTDLHSKKTGERKAVHAKEDGNLLCNSERISEQQGVGGAEMKTKNEKPTESSEQDVSLKLSIVETEPEQSLIHTRQDSANGKS
ncbi:PREDICTED: uncharacterized protein LOC107098318 isoform X3 [Cyprinodon variegatus]|uniref:uncharacterized protein LOC107098318 isoform X3 n=1 Tax=Cyprinodon variegatus TaxID=28743 RepID=UPI000742AF36|nr:PREDICTED: uncharacterized protein LOC107098318 isoform X3 [Cyprinodon variegatus]